jgi:tetratricopeptide (TPR) repeat protein
MIEAARRALARGDLAKAEELCHAIVTTLPGDAQAWCLLTETALRRNRPDAAIVCADRAAALSPRDPMAHVMRAKCLVLAGAAGEALKAAEDAARITGRSPEVEEALGAIFGMLGLHGRAIGLFRNAVAARPDAAQLLYNFAATERMVGELEAAEAHCDRAIALDPNLYRAYSLRADLRIQTAGRNHIEEMETLIARGIPNWQGEVMLRYALGKECEDLERYARAFHHYKAGADLQRRHVPYDLRSDVAFIDAIIATHTPSALRSAPAGFDGERPIFIVGLPRSGTTLVERIVAGHRAVVAAGELGAFPLALSRHAARRAAAGPSASSALWLELDLEALGRAYVAEARATGIPPAARFIDKFPGNYLYCGLLHRALPKARIIVLRRDPLDSCLAIYKTLFHGTYPFSYDLDELATYYSAFRRLIDHWKATLPKAALMEVAYEDIVRDVAGEARRLLDFLDLPWDDEVLRFHASTAPSTTASAVQIRRPLYASSVGKWRHFAAELAPLRAALARELPTGT